MITRIAQRLVAGKAQGDPGAVGQLARDVGIPTGQQPGQAADLLVDSGEVLGALQGVGGVPAVTDGARVTLQFGSHLFAPSAQIGKLRLEAGALLLGEVLGQCPDSCTSRYRRRQWVSAFRCRSRHRPSASSSDGSG